MKAYGGSGCIDPVGEVSFKPRPLYPGKKPPVRTGKEVERATDNAEKSKLSPIPGLELRTLGHLSQ
jgi:hypothetical protein